MIHLAFIYVLLLLAGITVQLACAGNSVVQSAPLPVIEGKINGMDVVAQGDSVAFFAGKLPGEYGEESCAEDLHCTLHKNHTRAVHVSPYGVLLQLNPDHLEKDDDEEDDDSSSPVLPSMTLNTLKSSSTIRFLEPVISTEEIEPTPTLATLYTGNPVVDQTPGLAWVNSETMRLLATTVETLGFLSTSTTSTTGDDFTLLSPSPTETVKVMTITGELDGLRRQLMASATVPVPTPVRTNSVDPGLEDNEVWLETESDVLRVRPSPIEKYGKISSGTHPFTFSVKQVPTVTGGSPSESHENVSATPDSTPTESSQASNLQSSEEQSVAAEINDAPEPGLMQWAVSVMVSLTARVLSTILPNPAREFEEEDYLLPMPEGATTEMIHSLNTETIKLKQKLKENNDVICFVCRSTFRKIFSLIDKFHCLLTDIADLHPELSNTGGMWLESCRRVYTTPSFTQEERRDSVEAVVDSIGTIKGAIRKLIDGIRRITQKLESIECSNENPRCLMIIKQIKKSWLVAIHQQINELEPLCKDIDDFTESFRSEMDKSQESSSDSEAIISDYLEKLQSLGSGFLESRDIYFDRFRKLSNEEF